MMKQSLIFSMTGVTALTLCTVVIPIDFYVSVLFMDSGMDTETYSVAYT